MAQTTQRIIELVVKLQGAKSLEELEKVTEEINDELKQVGENAEAFEDLAKLANDAVAQVKKVDDELSQVTAQEKTEAIRKVGEGLVGAFQVAAGASLFFGKKTSEELERVIAKVGGLFNMVDGLDKVSKVFAANNIKALKATVKGFQESAIAAKLFGTTTKAALTATGIGALVVILGTIIANFDKIKQAAAKAFDSMRNAFPVIDKIGNLVDNLKEKFGTLGNFVKGVGAAMEKLFQLKFREIADAFNAAVEEGKQLNAVVDEYKTKILDTQQAHENRIKLLQAEGNKQQEILNLEKQRNQEIVSLLSSKEKLTELTDEETDALQEAKFQLELLTIEQNKLNEAKTKEAAANKESTKTTVEKKEAVEEMSAEEKAAQELAIKNIDIENKVMADNLELQKLIDNVILSTADDLSKQEYTLNMINGQLYNELDGQEKKLKLLEEQYKALTDAEKQSLDGKNLENDILEAKVKVQKTQAEIKKNQKEINDLTKKTEAATQDWQEGLGRILADYGELIGASADLVNAAMELAIQSAEAEAEAEIAKIEKIQEAEMAALEKKQEAETEAAEEAVEKEKERQEELQDSIDDLKDEALDAEGERYEAIQAEIEAQEAAKAEAAAMEIQRQNEVAALEAQQLAEKAAMEAKYEADKKAANSKAAKLAKQQAIVDAIINTALSVLNALATSKPFLPMGPIMAAVAGALGAVQIALIAKQPTYATGGYTGDGDVNQPAGIVHAGEYVVPQKVVRNPAAASMIETLEGMRLRGYADGGTVTIPNIPTSDEMLDYKRIGDEVARALKENPQFVSWVEWRDMNTKMQFIGSRAALGKR